LTALLAAAVADNMQWCQRVCRAHGIPSRTDTGVWSAASPAPPFYPDAITTDPSATAVRVDHVLAGRHPASVKDSYAGLNLSPYGFAPLFSASWIALIARPDGETAAATWESVRAPAVLAEWTAAHGAAGVFPPSLLVDPAVLFLARREGGRIVAGAIANIGDEAIGLSNFFAPASMDDPWGRIVAEFRARFPGAPIVGYERDGDLAAARAAGFCELGQLRVWARPGNS
jgi:hypothetical protein